jgi:CDP-glucose 4,6-dehydratase
MENLVMKESFNNYYKGKKVFVTGHTGFKGAWFITWLHLLGADVKGYALAPEDENGLFNIVKDQFPFQHIVADIRDRVLLEKELLDFKPDFVFHLAAQALVRRSYQIPSETFEVNAIGTANVLEAVNKLPGKCTVVVITTDKVYENKETDYLYTEEDMLGGYDPYSASKAAAEIVVSSFRNSFFNVAKYASHQKALISVRAGNVIGGGDWSKDRIIPDIVRSLKNGGKVFVRNPHAVRPWQHVLEPLSGYLQAGMLADKDAADFSGAYNFGPQADDHLPVKALVETAIDCWGSGAWTDGYDASQPHEAVLLKLSINKANKILQWQPKLNSKQAIEWTINWYKQSRETVYDFTLQQIENYQQQ